MEQEQLKSIIESILFVSPKPLTVKDFSKLLDQQAFAVQSALDELAQERKNCGVVLLENNGEYQFATNSANSTQVKNFLNAELREKLTDATVEVLAIIAYRQPISKNEIEAIRGVNSQYSLRQLLMRGMVEKIPNPHDARGFLYQTTTEFLMHLGLSSVKDLPEFQKLVEQVKLPETPALQERKPEDQATQPEQEAAQPSEQQPSTEHEPMAAETEQPEANTNMDQPSEAPIVTEQQITETVIIEEPAGVNTQEKTASEMETENSQITATAPETDNDESEDEDEEFDDDDEDDEE